MTTDLLSDRLKAESLPYWDVCGRDLIRSVNFADTVNPVSDKKVMVVDDRVQKPCGCRIAFLIVFNQATLGITRIMRLGCDCKLKSTARMMRLKAAGKKRDPLIIANHLVTVEWKRLSL